VRGAPAAACGFQGAEVNVRGRFLRSDGLGALLSSSRALTFPDRFGSAPSWSEQAVRAAALDLVGSLRGRIAAWLARARPDRDVTTGS
jgi:hypothetical protein